MSLINAVPINERYPRLEESLLGFARDTHAVKSVHPTLIPEDASPFLYLCYPWISESANAEQQRLLAARRWEFEVAGFPGAKAAGELQEILTNDKHLRECCVSLGQLAQFVDNTFITHAVSLLMTSASSERLKKLFEDFVLRTYGQGRFKAVSLSHVFNFEADAPSLRFESVRIERLDGPTISMVLGEQSLTSFLHPPNCGDFFIVSEREGACDDYISWLIDERYKANLFVQVLQYFKDGIVHVDYAAPHFLPHWVNQVRKWGIFFLGNPRCTSYENSTRPYHLSPDEERQVMQWWSAYQAPDIVKRLSDHRNSLRQAGLRAGDYYEYSHSDEKPVGRLIGLAIALESLFSPNDQGELIFRIAQSVSQLIGETAERRVQLFDEVKRFYSRRSKLIHGQYNVEEYYAGKFVTHEECDRWASIVRQGIMRCLVLYLRGNTERSTLLENLWRAALSEELANQLRTDSNPHTFLREFTPQGTIASSAKAPTASG